MNAGQGNFPIQKIKSKFDPSGGPSGRSSAFHVNPMYQVMAKGDGGTGERNVEFTLKTNPNLSVSMSLLRGGGRKEYVSKRDELFGSGDYRAGVATMSGRLKVDTPYTIVASTWNAGEMGAFMLECAGKNMEIRELKKETETMRYNYKVEGMWTRENGVGCANHGRYTSNPSITFTAAKPGELFGRLTIKGGRRDIASNFSIFEGSTLSPHASSIGRDCGLLVSSNDGVYKGGGGGVTIGLTRVKASTHIIVMSTFEPVTNLMFTLHIYSSVQLRGLTQV